MQRYHLQVMTEHAGLVPFTVEAENLIIENNAYWFYILVNPTDEEISKGKYSSIRKAVAIYPSDKTIVQQIEDIII